MREFAAPGLPELGVLYVAPPLAHIRGTLRRLLFGSVLPLDDPVEEVPAIEVTPEGLSHLRKLLLGGLSEAELRERRAVLVEKCSGFGLVSPGRMFEVVCRAGVLFNHPTYCLRSTMGAIERSDPSPERIIFEVTESEKDDGHLRNILGFYRRNGFRIALDGLGAGYASLNLLADFARTSSSWMPT